MKKLIRCFKRIAKQGELPLGHWRQSNNFKSKETTGGLRSSLQEQVDICFKNSTIYSLLGRYTYTESFSSLNCLEMNKSSDRFLIQNA